MIVFVGSNPSVASGTSIPFDDDTRSYKVLLKWVREAIPDPAVTYYNVSNVKTPNNRPLKVSEIRECVPSLRYSLRGCDRVVALGKTAHRALDMAGIEHLEMPHPSGRNRLLNDKAFVEQCISKLRSYAQR